MKGIIMQLGILAMLLMGGTAKSQETLTLNEAVAIALAKNFNLQIAKNDEEIADIFNNWGNAGRLPTVSGQAGYGFNINNLDQRLVNGTNIKRNGATFQNENASVLAQWRVFNGFRVVAAKNRLDEQEKIASLAVRQQANLVVYDVVTAYLNVLRLSAQIDALVQNLTLFEERMRLAENRFNIGVAAKSDYLQAVADYNQARNGLVATENSRDQEKVRLNSLLSRDPFIQFETSDSVTQVTIGDKATVLAAIDTLNPTLLIARSQLHVLMQQRREINANRLPTLTLNAGAGINNNVNSAGFTLRNTTYGPNTSLQLAVPIFQGGVVKQNLRANSVQQESQRVQIESVRNTLSALLAGAINNYNNARRQYDIENENMKVVTENNTIAMERFRKASITTVELRQVQISLIESQNRMINALYQMRQSEADVLLITNRLVE
jgi:outer membrane protein TolC